MRCEYDLFWRFGRCIILEDGEPRLRPLMTGDVWVGLLLFKHGVCWRLSFSDRSLPFGGGLCCCCVVMWLAALRRDCYIEQLCYQM